VPAPLLEITPQGRHRTENLVFRCESLKTPSTHCEH